MFLPAPSYCPFSLVANKSSRKVGSRSSPAGFLPALADAFVPAFEAVGRGKIGEAACALESGVDDPPISGISSYAHTISAKTPRTIAHVICFLFSSPSFTKFLPSSTPQVLRPTLLDLEARQ